MSVAGETFAWCAISLPWSLTSEVCIIRGSSVKYSITASAGALGVFRGQGERAGEPAHPLHQRRRARGPVLPDDQVALPVPGYPPLRRVLATLRDRDHPHDRPASGAAVRAGPALGPFGLQENPTLGEFSRGIA